MINHDDIRIRTVFVTPEQARAWLTQNTDNRTKRAAHIKNMARIMRGGNWRYTHQGIAFSREGRLIDGQHRLEALVQADTPQKMLVCENVDAATFAVLDQQKMRDETIKALRLTKPVRGALRLLARVAEGISRPQYSDFEVYKALCGAPIATINPDPSDRGIHNLLNRSILVGGAIAALSLYPRQEDSIYCHYDDLRTWYGNYLVERTASRETILAALPSSLPPALQSLAADLVDGTLFVNQNARAAESRLLEAVYYFTPKHWGRARLRPTDAGRSEIQQKLKLFFQEGRARLAIHEEDAGEAGPARGPRMDLGEIVAKTEEITPDMAEAYLQGEDVKGGYQGLAHAMRSGQWRYTHQGIALDSQGHVVDGRARLRAVIASGCTVRMLVFRNVDPRARVVIDTGLFRTVADLFHMTDQEAAIVNMAYGLRHSTKTTRGNREPLRPFLAAFKPVMSRMALDLSDGNNPRLGSSLVYKGVATALAVVLTIYEAERTEDETGADMTEVIQHALASYKALVTRSYTQFTPAMEKYVRYMDERVKTLRRNGPRKAGAPRLSLQDIDEKNRDALARTLLIVKKSWADEGILRASPKILETVLSKATALAKQIEAATVDGEDILDLDGGEPVQEEFPEDVWRDVQSRA